MKLPAILSGESRTRLLQGAALGAIAAMVIGFGWGGWTLGSTANKMADARAATAVNTALAPICASQFVHNASAELKAEFASKDSDYSRGEVIQKAFKKVGNNDLDYTLLGMCADAVKKSTAKVAEAPAKS